jgi:AraC-like DNA-binding protein
VIHSPAEASGESFALVNPFQRLMRLNDKQPLSTVAFQAPLPLSAAKDDPDSPASFSGVFHRAWPSLHLVALEGAPTTARLPARHWISLIFVAAGDVCLHLPDGPFRCSAGGCLFVPEAPATWESSAFSVVCLMFAPQQLTAMLKLMRTQELEWCASHRWDFSNPTCRKPSDGDVEACLLTTLQHLLHVTSELSLRQPILLTRLGISDQLSLITALLACPSLNTPLLAQPEDLKGGGVDEALEELTAYMLDHLAEPLNLSVLEKYSHYSRRSLQYAFRHRFGCTITQWVRSQRLDRAYQRLIKAVPGETVSSVAQACGYRSVSLFGIEFQNRFHIKPSVLLRQHQGKD